MLIWGCGVVLISSSCFWREGVVLLHPKRQEVSEWSPAQSCGGVGVLEGDGDRQADTIDGREGEHRSEEGFGVLQGETSKGRED